MSNFWLVDDKEVKSGDFTLQGKVEVIPSNTNCIAMIEEAKWDEYKDEEYISLKWKVLQPAEYKNRVIFQKIKVYENDENKAKKAQNMLLAINYNAKGNLHELQGAPTATELQKALCNKLMQINVQVWKMQGDDGSDREGNWIAAVKPKGDGVPDKVIKVEAENIAMSEEDESDAAFAF